MKDLIKGLSPLRQSNQPSASLTVEAALVTPLFIYFMLVFLYFIQIFTIQEQIQCAITKMGLEISRLSYVLEDFTELIQVEQFDDSILGIETDMGLKDMAKAAVNGGILKLYAKNYLDLSRINRSCIINGYEGISFYSSKIQDADGYIDIIARYQIKIPIRLFGLDNMQMLQRAKLRSWTGRQIPAAYTVTDEGQGEDLVVYITTTGTVYHVSRECSHIKLSLHSVIGIPSELRNDNGAKYYPCESCMTGKGETFATYYITSDGTRYHSKKDCSRIKRTVKEVKQSEVSGRTKCKRCGR